VGGTKTLKVNARVIAATNAPLEELIASGKFRADLFYRINQFSINLPPLRERLDDIPLLAKHFLAQNGHKKHDGAIPQEVMAKFLTYDWPGNVRELKFFVDRFALTGNTDHITEALGGRKDGKGKESSTNKIVETEAKMIHSALVEVRWNQRKAAENLGISYSSLRRRIEKHGLKNRPPSSF
jgi:transcriptional regulator with PAS, ATPase and Fis domain